MVEQCVLLTVCKAGPETGVYSATVTTARELPPSSSSLREREREIETHHLSANGVWWLPLPLSATGYLYLFPAQANYNIILATCTCFQHRPTTGYLYLFPAQAGVRGGPQKVSCREENQSVLKVGVALLQLWVAANDQGYSQGGELAGHYQGCLVRVVAGSLPPPHQHQHHLRAHLQHNTTQQQLLTATPATGL